MKALRKFLHVLFIGYPHEVVDVFTSVAQHRLFWTSAVFTTCFGFMADLGYLFWHHVETVALWSLAQTATVHVLAAVLLISSLWLLICGLIVGVPMGILAIEQGLRILFGDTQTNYFESL